MCQTQDRSEVAFFDVETTVPTRAGQGFSILEFGAILVCPKKLVELDNYSTLVRPVDPSHITSLSVRCNGITRDAVISAPAFAEIADKVFDILDGRIWAGHNIIKFDCARIREAYAEIGRPAPEPKGTIDTLILLTQRFGRRAGDMKMASLATYFGLGQQAHRSLDDVRMNLEVLKYCATVLFLESSLPDVFTVNSWVSPNATTRSRSNVKSSPKETSQNFSTPPSRIMFEDDTNLSPPDQGTEENHPIFSLVTHGSEEGDPNLAISSSNQPDPFDMGILRNQIETKSLQQDVTMEEKAGPESPEIFFTAPLCEGSSGYAGYIEPDEVSIPSINACEVPLFPGSNVQKIRLLHKDVILQLSCAHLKVRFGVNPKFVDHAGRPRLNFVVDVSPSLCNILDACNGVVKKLVEGKSSKSEWRPVVKREDFWNCPKARLHIPTAVHGDVAQYATEIFRKEASGTIQKLVFTKFDASELHALLKPGTFVDAFLSLDAYDYLQSAGIRLVAKKLIIQMET